MSAYRAAGYEALIKRYDIDAISNWHSSFAARETQVHKIEKEVHTVKEFYPERYWPGESTGEQLEFALKYDGINLVILFLIFQIIHEEDMLKNPNLYDMSLESYSAKLMPLIEYMLDEKGHMDIHNETGHWYGYINMTVQTEILYDFVRWTIETKLTDDLEFIVNYDRAKKLSSLSSIYLIGRLTCLYDLYSKTMANFQRRSEKNISII